jgi:hypothetical protein
MVWEVSMVDLHQTRAPDSYGKIDGMGWLFLAFGCAIIAVAAVIAYEAHETRPAPVSQIVAR